MHNPYGKPRENLKHNFSLDKIAVVSNPGMGTILHYLDHCMGSPISVDLETTGFDPHTCVITMIGISDDGENVIVIDPRKYDREFIVSLMQRVCKESQTVFHNAKFDLKFLQLNYGVEATQAECTFVMRKMLTCGLLVKADLATCSLDYLGFGHSKAVREQFLDNEDDATEEMEEYNARDVAITWHLYHVLKQWLEVEDLTTVYEEIERPLIPILADMELIGIDVDLEYLKKFEGQVAERLKVFQKDLDHKLITLNAMPKVTKALLKRDASQDQLDRGITHVKKFASSLNVNSPAQVKEVLNNLGFPVESAGKAILEDPPYSESSLAVAKELWGYSDASDEFALGISMDILGRILETRSAAKALSAFIRPLQGDYKDDKGKAKSGYVNPKTGKVHTSFHQMGTSSGRLSSKGPNVQQMPNPKREKGKASVFEGMHLRRAFIPPDGYQLVVYDYEACEFKILAEITGDEGLIYAVAQPDPHKANASIMYDKPIEEVTELERENAKTVIYTVVYGGGPRRVAVLLKTSVERAKQVITLLMDRFPKLAAWIKARRRMAVEYGFAVSMSGRKRYFDVPGFRNEWGRPYSKEERRELIARIERQGQNTPIQATNADITKLAKVRVDKLIRPLGGRLLLTIHDELVAIAPDAVAEECFKLMGEAMLSAEREFLEVVESKVKGQYGRSWEH